MYHLQFLISFVLKFFHWAIHSHRSKAKKIKKIVLKSGTHVYTQYTVKQLTPGPLFYECCKLVL